MILNEEKYAKDLLTGQRDDVKNIKQKIDLIARYNYHVLHKSDNDNYDSMVKWLNKHHDIFNEQSYSNVISDCIKRAQRRPFYNIDSIKITQKELDVITSQNNLRYEKILFVMLCMAKVQKISRGFDNGLIFYNITELFKMARVSVPVDERENILHSFLKSDLIGLPFKNDTKCLFVKFIDEDSDDVALELDEQDSNELAYSYLRHTKKSKIVRCAKCSKLIKQSNKFGSLCKGCQGPDDDEKIRWCLDCGKEFKVNLMNTKTYRCNECQSIVDKENTKLRVQKYREKHSM